MYVTVAVKGDKGCGGFRAKELFDLFISEQGNLGKAPNHLREIGDRFYLIHSGFCHLPQPASNVNKRSPVLGYACGSSLLLSATGKAFRTGCGTCLLCRQTSARPLGKGRRMRDGPGVCHHNNTMRAEKYWYQ